MDKEATPKPATHDYRGACVEVRMCDLPNVSQTNRSGIQDLQLPPAFCLPQDAPLLKALEAAYDRDFDHLP